MSGRTVRSLGALTLMLLAVSVLVLGTLKPAGAVPDANYFGEAAVMSTGGTVTTFRNAGDGVAARFRWAVFSNNTLPNVCMWQGETVGTAGYVYFQTWNVYPNNEWLAFNDGPGVDARWWVDDGSGSCASQDPGPPGPSWEDCEITGVESNWGSAPQAGVSYEVNVTFSGQATWVEFDYGDGVTEAVRSPDDPTSPVVLEVVFPTSAAYDWRVRCGLEDGTAGPSEFGEDGLDVRAGDMDGLEGLGACIPSGWQLLNPVAYVQGMGCVFRWAFVPPEGTGDAFTAMKDSFEGSALSALVEPFTLVFGVLEAFESGYADIGENEGGCEGPTFELPLMGGDDPVTVQPLNGCEGTAVASIRSTFRIAMEVGVYVGTGWVVVQLLAGSIGMHVGSGKGDD